MMKRILSFTILLFIPALLIGFIYEGIHLYVTPYDSFLQSVLHSLQREDLRHTLEQTYFTAEKYHVVQIIGLVISGLSFLCSIVFIRSFFRCLYHIECRLEDVVNGLKNQFLVLRQMTTLQKLSCSLLFILVIIRSVYYANHFYIQYDEAWNYNYFLQKNILFSFFAYNNYPLHNVITFVFLKIFPTNTFFLRLPVILFGLASCLSLLIISQRIFKETWLSILSVCLFASLPVTIYYMLYARGVMVSMFFLLWLYDYGWKMTRNNEHDSLPVFLMLHVLGSMAILTHPVFIVMQWATVLTVLRLKRARLSLRKMNIAFLCSLLGSGFIFLCFFLGSGVSLSPTGSTISIRYDLPYHSYAAFYGGMTWSFYFLLVLHIFFLFRKDMQEYLYILLLNILILVSIPLLHLLLGNYPPERALPYLFLPVVFGFGLMGKFLSLQKISWMIWRKSGDDSPVFSGLPNPPKEGAAIRSVRKCHSKQNIRYKAHPLEEFGEARLNAPPVFRVITSEEGAFEHELNSGHEIMPSLRSVSDGRTFEHAVSGYMKLFGLFVLLLSVYLNISTYKSKYMNWSKELDHQVFLLAEKLREKNIHTLYYTSKDFNYFVPGITYYSSLHSFPISCYTNQKGSTRYNPAMQNSALAIACEADTSLNKSVLFRLDRMVVYLN